MHIYYIYLDGISVGDVYEVGRDSGYYGVGDAVGYVGCIDGCGVGEVWVFRFHCCFYDECIFRWIGGDKLEMTIVD